MTSKTIFIGRSLLLFIVLGGLFFMPSFGGSVGSNTGKTLNSQKSEGCWLAAGIGNKSNGPDLLSSSNNPELDAAHQREGLALIEKFGVTPRGYFFDDGEAPNAYATNKVVNRLGPDGTVVFGLQLVNSELRRDGGYGLAVPAIMAHEFAHIVQFKRASKLSTKQKELQADYLAGWYLANRWIYTDVRPAFEAFFQMGDYEFNNPNHHGTPQQRLSSLQAGFQSKGLTFDQAYERSSEYVRSN